MYDRTNTHLHRTSTHYYTQEDYGFSEDLAEIIEAWPDLSDEARARIVEIVKESR